MKGKFNFKLGALCATIDPLGQFPTPETLPPGPCDEATSLAILARAGIPVMSHRLVRSADEAAAAAEALGLPVALKIVSPDITHRAISAAWCSTSRRPRRCAARLTRSRRACKRPRRRQGSAAVSWRRW